MKSVKWLASILFLALAAAAHGQQDQLMQLVDQLRQSPDNDSLRARIIKLARETRPAPVVPDEALRREGRGKFAFKNAKSPDDYVASANEYEQAVAAAPWVAGYYSDLCTIYEKAGKYAQAKHSCEILLPTLTDPQQIAETKERIAGLEFGMEKSQQATQAKEAAVRAEEAKSGWLVGSWKSHWCGIIPALNLNMCNDSRWGVSYFQLQADKKDNLVYFSNSNMPDGILRVALADSGPLKWEYFERVADSRFPCPGQGAWRPVSPQISADKQKIFLEVPQFKLPRCEVNGSNQLFLEK